MGAGSIKLQAGDTRVATVTFEDGAAGNVSVVVPKEGGALASEAYVASQIGAILVIGDASQTAKGIIEIATNAEVQTGTDTTRAVTPAGLLSTIIGQGQTWQDVKASRAVATTYTNSTGKPIEVIIGTSCTVVAGYGRFLINGLVVYTGQDYGTGTAFLSPLSFVVPNGSTYRYEGVTGTPSIHSWLELR